MASPPSPRGTFLEHTRAHVERAASAIGLSVEILAALQEPKYVHAFEIPLPMENGSAKIFKAWRVQHSDVLGPFKGGIRYHSASHLDEVAALASLMTWKTSLAGIPFGGAKGALTVDPKSLSRKELEAVSRSYVRRLSAYLGPQRDVPAPDVGTNPQVMAWMADEYAKLTGSFEPAAFTGKPIEIGGSLGRDTATGFGGTIVLREFIQSQNQESKIGNQKQTVAIQGFGAVGSVTARLLAKDGWHVVALSDSRGAIYDPDGIGVEEIIRTQEEKGSLNQRPCSLEEASGGTCRVISNEALLELDVDVLVPAALENVITVENAGRIKARMILEMANGPVSGEADGVLASRGIEVIPDILANSGGVIGSYFEWVQGLSRLWWDEEEVLARIERVMGRAFRAIAKERAQGGTWREACYRLAVKRVAEAMRLRGLI